MRAGYDDDWYPGCDDFSDEEEPDVDEYNALNHDDFLYPNESSFRSQSDQAQCDEHDDDELNFGRPYNCPQRQCCSSGSSGWPATRADTRVMRNVAIVNHGVSRRHLSALEKRNSVSSRNSGHQTAGFVTYSDQRGQDFVEDYSDYLQPRRQQRQTPRVSPVPGLQKMIENLIYGTKVVIFSKTSCPYCIIAKEIFDYIEQPYTTVELNRRRDGDQIQEIMGQITGGTSVPRVFINGIFIGGGNDIKRLYGSGELEEMLDLE